MRVNLRSPTSGKYAQPGNRIAGDHIADYEARLDPEVLLLCSLVPSSVLRGNVGKNSCMLLIILWHSKRAKRNNDYLNDQQKCVCT